MTTLLQALGIRLPIFQAPMAGVSTPAMAAAVSNAGGLGAIGVGAADAETARQMIRDVRSASNCPFNVNVFCHRPALRDGNREAAWAFSREARVHALDARQKLAKRLLRGYS